MKGYKKLCVRIPKGFENQMPLGLLTIGDKAEVIEINEENHQDSCCTDTCKSDNSAQLCRIEDLGLRNGKIVEMLNNRGRGPMLIKIDESRIAIGRGIAMRIMVRRCS